MNIENNISYNNKLFKPINEWLFDISSLNGRICTKNKRSYLRAKLVLILDIKNTEHIEIIELYDRNLWKEYLGFNKVKPEALMDLQVKLSLILHKNKKDEILDSFDIHEEFYNFVIGQSTLLALFAALILFSKVLVEKFENVLMVAHSLFICYFITIFIVLYIIDNSIKKLTIIISIALILMLLIYYVYSIKVLLLSNYTSTIEVFQIVFLFLLNMAMFGSYLFASIYSANGFTNNKLNVPRTVFLIIGMFLYGVVISTVLQMLLDK